MTKQQGHRWLGGLVMLVAMVAAACGGGSETVDEQAANPATTAATAATITEAADDVNDDSATEESSGADAATSSGNDSIPDDLPVPLPEGGSVSSAIEAPSEGFLKMRYEGSRFDEFVSFYQDWFDGAGGLDVNRTDDEFYTLFTWQVGDQGGYTVNVAGDPSLGLTAILIAWPRSG